MLHLLCPFLPMYAAPFHRPSRLLVLPLALACLLISPAVPAQNCPPDEPESPPWLQPPATPFRHVISTAAGDHAAHVYVMATGTPLGRPFVFVEGIDFDLGTFPATPFQLGDFGWSAFNGCAPEAYPMMAGMPALLDTLLASGFHPVLIDFEEGAGDLHANAALLADILIHLREHRSDPRPMIVSGASMGGQVARIALRLLERGGEPHCTQLYLSLDSPHQGANVPIGLQQLIQALPGTAPVLVGLSSALTSPAARQLLVRQTLPLGPRAAYQDSLDAIGWPGTCRNAAIANGGTTPIASDDAPLLTYSHSIISSDILGDIGGLLDLEIHPDPGSPWHPAAGPMAPVTCWAEMPEGEGWPWPLETAVGFGNPAIQEWPGSIDLMPGGTRPSMAQFVAAFNAALGDLSMPWPLAIPPIGEEEYQPLHSFIPTPSALGIPAPWDASTLVDPASLSPFDAVHIGSINEPHSEVNPENTAFVLEQLRLTECPLEPGIIAQDTALAAGGDWGLPALTITGRLCLHSPDPMFGEAAAPSGSHGSFNLYPCSGAIDVAETGTFELGGGEGNNAATAELRLESGSSLHIRGKLVLHPGSRLVIATGAELHLDGGIVDQRSASTIHCAPGSSIRTTGHVLWTIGNDGLLSMEGDARLDADSHWHHQVSEGALVRMAGVVSFQLEEGSSMLAHAQVPATHWVVEEGGLLEVAGMGTWRHFRSGMRLMGQAKVIFSSEGPVRFDEASWLGIAQDTIRRSGEIWLQDHQGHEICIDQSHGTFRMYDSEWHGGSTLLRNNRIRWGRVEFEDHPVHHAQLGDEPTHLMEACRFNLAQDGLRLVGPGRMRLEDCVFGTNAIGLVARMSRVELSCCAFISNDLGFMADRAWMVMQPEGGGGWNNFEDNDVHMAYNQAPPPALLGGANHFGDAYSGWASGTLDLTCSGGAVDWPIHGQSWNWPIGWPQILTGLSATDPDGGSGCPIAALDLTPVEPQTCRNKEKREME